MKLVLDALILGFLLPTLGAISVGEDAADHFLSELQLQHLDFNRTQLNSQTLAKDHRLTKRTSEPVCPLPPKASINYAFNCIDYPDKRTCVQTCLFGYTLPEGIQRKVTCMKEYNEWRPLLENCKPFISCEIELQPGTSGKLRCISETMITGPWCEVSCGKLEDKPAVSPTPYFCDIRGKWSPPLPHCVREVKKKKLVPPPKGVKKVRKG